MRLRIGRIAIAAVFLGVGTAAGAQEMHFAGVASGCFYTVGGCVPAGSATLGGMTYSSQNTPQFDGYTDASGYLGIGGQFANFGMFTLTNQAFDYTGWNFLLEVMFTAPPGVSTTNSAWLQGKVKSTSGGVTLHFDTEPVHLEALDGTYFDFSVHEVSVSRGTTANPGVNYISGEVQVTATPEPATVGLMICGLIALVPVYRRRRGRDS